MRPSRFLILGGTGFVGTALSHRLIRDGHSLCLPSRHPDRYPGLRVLPGLRLLRADIHDPKQLDRLVGDADVVVNLVGILNESGRDGSGFRRAHTELTDKVVNACTSHGVRRLLHMSSLQASVEGPSHYLRSKGAAEQRIRDSSAGLSWTIFRPSVIFGEHDSLTRRFADLLQYVPVLPLARADALFAPVYIRDVVEAMIRTLSLPESSHRAYDLGGPDRMTLAELVGAIAKITQRRRFVFGIPDWAGRLQADVFERLPGKLLSRDNFNSLSVASVPAHDGLAELGIRPASLLQIAPTYLTPR